MVRWSMKNTSGVRDEKWQGNPAILSSQSPAFIYTLQQLRLDMENLSNLAFS